MINELTTIWLNEQMYINEKLFILIFFPFLVRDDLLVLLLLRRQLKQIRPVLVALWSCRPSNFRLARLLVEFDMKRFQLDE